MKLTNWKNFISADIILKSRIFIVGPNASGKSNLLDVLRFLHDIAKPGGGLFSAIEQRGGISKIRCLSARNDPIVRIEIHMEETGKNPKKWIYSLAIAQQPHGRHEPYIESEKVECDGKLVISRPNDKDQKDIALLSQTHLEQISANIKFRELVQFFTEIRYFHLVPQLIRHSQAFTGPNIPEDPYGRNFLELLAKTTNPTRNSRLKKIEKELKIFVPHLTALSFTTDKLGIPHLEARYEHWRPNAGKQREDQFSDGTLRLIGLFWSLLEPRDSPLLLEEPELSLHVEIIRRLPSIIHEIDRSSKRKRGQIFISTHSADLISDKSIGGEEVIILTPESESTIISIASSNKQIRLLLDSGLSIGDIITQFSAPSGIVQTDLNKYYHE